jgi:hypothetical protein
MEASKGFHGTAILNELEASKDAKAGTPNVRFEIGGEYVPGDITSSRPSRPRTKEGF